MSGDPFPPAPAAAGRTLRERGTPVGATGCGCPLASWALMHASGRLCSGCGQMLPPGEWRLRTAALSTARRCAELSRAAAEADTLRRVTVCAPAEALQHACPGRARRARRRRPARRPPAE